MKYISTCIKIAGPKTRLAILLQKAGQKAVANGFININIKESDEMRKIKMRSYAKSLWRKFNYIARKNNPLPDDVQRLTNSIWGPKIKDFDS